MVYSNGQIYLFESVHQVRYHKDKKHYFCGYCMKYVKNVLNHIYSVFHIANKEIYEEEIINRQLNEDIENGIFW